MQELRYSLDWWLLVCQVVSGLPVFRCYHEEDSLKRFKVESYKCTNESLSGRYVYVRLNSNRKDVLRLCEVEVISNPIPSKSVI